MSLPCFMALQEENGDKLVCYIETDGKECLQLNATQIFDPRAKFAVENGPHGLVHIRSFYNNKYWIRFLFYSFLPFFFICFYLCPRTRMSCRLSSRLLWWWCYYYYLFYIYSPSCIYFLHTYFLRYEILATFRFWQNIGRFKTERAIHNGFEDYRFDFSRIITLYEKSTAS